VREQYFVVLKTQNPREAKIFASTTVSAPGLAVSGLQVTNASATPLIALQWIAVYDASYYQVSARTAGTSGSFSRLGATDSTNITATSTLITYVIKSSDLTAGTDYEIQVSVII
jgi:hypothetical protein